MKKIFLFWVAYVLFLNISGQTVSKYNSFCLYHNSNDAECFACISTDSITYNINDSIFQTIWRENKCKRINVCDVDSIIFYDPYVENIMEINQNIDYWDKAYVTPIGYFCYNSFLPYEGDSINRDIYEMLSYGGFYKFALTGNRSLAEIFLSVIEEV